MSWWAAPEPPVLELGVLAGGVLGDGRQLNPQFWNGGSLGGAAAWLAGGTWQTAGGLCGAGHAGQGGKAERGARHQCLIALP